MLDPDYFDGKSQKLVELYQQLEDYILKDVSRRVLAAGKLTATADRLVWMLQQYGESRAAIEKQLSKMTGIAREELRKLLQNAAIASWEEDVKVYAQIGIAEKLEPPLNNPRVQELLDAMWKKSQGELDNLTRTTMNKAQQDLIDLLSAADMRVGSGAQSYAQAACQVLDEYAGKGVVVNYPTGTKRTLEAAVLCCTRTAMNQTAAQVTDAYIAEGKVEYVIISAHSGARVAAPGQPALADHSKWQGKAYKIVGEEPGYPNLLKSTGYDIDPMTGTGTVVNPLGLHGYNCRHSHGPWQKGMENPWLDKDGKPIIDPEESEERYKNSQKLRAMERGIRKMKRQLIAKRVQLDSLPDEDPAKSGTQNDYDQLALKLTEQNRQYNDFCRENDLQPQYSRNKVSGYTRIDEKTVNEAYKRTIKAQK